MNVNRGVTLLIVDDDARVRELAEYAAHRTGLFSQVATTVDGEAAFEKLKGSADADLPSIILTDLSMPRLDGLEFVKRLHGEPKWRDIPVAMFSSSNRPNDEILAIEAGCRLFFPKPSSLDQLTSLMAVIAELTPRTAAPDRPAPRAAAPVAPAENVTP